MDLDELRTILSRSRTDVWDLIDTAITVASLDYGHELKDRRDHIVERLYTASFHLKPQDDIGPTEVKESSPITPQSNQPRDEDDDAEVEEEEEEEEPEERDPYGGLFDDVDEEEEAQDEDEETKILKIKDKLEDLDQSEDALVELLQTLADMDITFKALKETDIGRHVNLLRKHSSTEVRRLVKQLVRKWKDLVDEWVKVNTPDKHTASTLIDGDSPQHYPPRKSSQNGHYQVPDLGYSPNPRNGNSSESEPKQKVVPRNDAPARPHSFNPSASAPPKLQRQQKESSVDPEKLATASKRLQENYQKDQNARKQRKIQVMDINEIPKPKNGFFARNKGGLQGRHR